MNNQIRHTLRGTLSWKIEKDGKVLRESSTYNNLILNQGLDFIASYPFADCFLYCVVGSTGNAPVRTDTGLGNEIKRTNNYSLSGNSNGTQLVNNVYTIFRTFTFVADVVPYVYREVGFSPIGIAGNNLFSKALIKDSSGVPVEVSVNIGETLTVRYELSIEIFDATLSLSSGHLRFQKIGLKAISDVNGSTINYDDTNGCNEPSIQANLFLSSSSAAPEPFGSCADRSPATSKTGSLSNYVTGAYNRKKGALFKTSELPSSWRSVGVGSASSHGAVFVYNADHFESNKAYFVNFTYYWVHHNNSSFVEWLDFEDSVYLSQRVKKANTYAYFAL